MKDFDGIQVYVAHDEPVVGHGVLAILESRPCMVTRRCAMVDAQCLMRREVFSRDDLIVADHAAALELLHTFRDLHPCRRPKVLVLTRLDREWDVRSALKAGANGYVLQDCSPEKLIEAVDVVCLGRRHLSPELTDKLADGMFRNDLTARELEVLAAMSTGASNKRISMALGITNGTVKSHVRAIFNKVGACARTEAVALAAQRGLTEMRLGGPVSVRRLPEEMESRV